METLERHLLRARDLADSHHDEPLDLRALAREAHVSPRHFSRTFRRVFGETPYQYLLTRRLERARHLLRTTGMSVAEICLEVGFRNAYRGPSDADRIPLCFAMAWARRAPVGAFREDTAPSAD